MEHLKLRVIEELAAKNPLIFEAMSYDRLQIRLGKRRFQIQAIEHEISGYPLLLIEELPDV